MDKNSDANTRGPGLFGGVWARLKGVLGGDAETDAGDAAAKPVSPRDGAAAPLPEGSELSTGTYNNLNWREEETGIAPPSARQVKPPAAAAAAAVPTPAAAPAPANTVDGFFSEFDFLEDTAVDGVQAVRPPAKAEATPPKPAASAAPAAPTPKPAKPDDGVGTVTSDTVFSQFNWQDEDEDEDGNAKGKPNER